VKQLVATSDRAVEPCLRSLSEYVADRYDETRFTFFEGVERVRPSTALMADPYGSSVVRYWEPMPRSGRTTDVQEGFREQLVAAVRSRTDGAESTVSHLTGGLDSTTIAASAQILADRGQLRSTFRTVSAVFPGYANDESEAIGEVATLQPFPHNEFVPQHETIERLEADMWESDTPRPALIDALWSGTIDIGHATGADLVLAGTGGDEVLDQYSLAADLLRRGHLLRWGREVHARAAWSNRHVGTIAGESARVAIPGYLKRPLRRMLDRATPDEQSLIHPSVAPILDRTPVEANPTVRAFPSLTQNLMVSSTRAPLLGLLLEYDEQRYARDGLVVSYPYLDRRLVEFVAAVPLVRRPSVGGSKALARSAFSQSLPASVIERRFKTVANDSLDAVVARLAPQFRERYATITDAASPYLNANWYHANLPAADASEPGFRFGESLWKAWTIMAWLDGLDRYRTAKPNDAEHH
jgi:asparagine synthase (glutamine-hydrolysing)